jgi:hypothetical protein
MARYRAYAKLRRPGCVFVVMPGLVPGIHAFNSRQGVDGWDKPGHDGSDLLC